MRNRWQNRFGLARWDGADRNPLGKGIEKPYFHFTADKVVLDSDDVAHMVGEFDMAGGMPNRVRHL